MFNLKKISKNFSQKKIFPLEDQAFEDFAIDYGTGIAYMGGDDRTWFHTFNLSNKHPKKQGKFYTFDIQSETFQQLKLNVDNCLI